MNKRKVLFIITNFDLEFPKGAGYNRVVNYCKSLSKVGVKCIIVSNIYNYLKSFNTIHKEHFSVWIGEKVKHKKSTFNDFHFHDDSRFVKNIVSICEEKFSLPSIEVSFFLYYSTLSLVVNCLKNIKRKYKIVIEKNELKTAIAINKTISSRNLFKTIGFILVKCMDFVTGVVTDILAIRFDGIISISTKMFNLYNKFNKQVIRIPILNNVDYKNILSGKNSYFSIGYFGILSEQKDGIFTLLDAVIELNHQKKGTIFLKIYGNGLKEIISKLERKIEDIGFISFENEMNQLEVEEKLREFDLLVVVRPRNLQTEYGFSTKLAEYLSSGVPVLTTNVSDNNKYIIDGKNGFILPVKKAIVKGKLLQKLQEITSLTPETLRNIGFNGRKLCNDKFNPNKYSSLLTNIMFKENN